MKTQLPTPGAYNCFDFTESQLKAAMVAAYCEAIEEAAAYIESYDTSQTDRAAFSIRKLKEQTP